MSNVRKDCEIESYLKVLEDIEVYYHHPGDKENSTYKIPGANYVMWLCASGKLKSSTGLEPDNQVECDITFEQYWECTDWNLKKDDLREYMLLNEHKQFDALHRLQKSTLHETVKDLVNIDFANQVMICVEELIQSGISLHQIGPVKREIYTETFGQFTS